MTTELDELNVFTAVDESPQILRTDVQRHIFEIAQHLRLPLGDKHDLHGLQLVPLPAYPDHHARPKEARPIPGGSLSLRS